MWDSIHTSFINFHIILLKIYHRNLLEVYRIINYFVLYFEIFHSLIENLQLSRYSILTKVFFIKTIRNWFISDMEIVILIVMIIFVIIIGTDLYLEPLFSNISMSYIITIMQEDTFEYSIYFLSIILIKNT